MENGVKLIYQHRAGGSYVTVEATCSAVNPARAAESRAPRILLLYQLRKFQVIHRQMIGRRLPLAGAFAFVDVFISFVEVVTTFWSD